MAYGYSVRLIELNKRANPRLVGVRLGKVCIKRNIPVSAVARELGVSRQTVYNWFVGESNPQNLIVDAVEQLIELLSQSK
jgi:DNA-binding phage protein